MIYILYDPDRGWNRITVAQAKCVLKGMKKNPEQFEGFRLIETIDRFVCWPKILA